MTWLEVEEEETQSPALSFRSQDNVLRVSQETAKIGQTAPTFQLSASHPYT